MEISPETQLTCFYLVFVKQIARKCNTFSSDRACVIDSLVLEITCVLYHCTMCTRHPDLVSFALYAIPILLSRIFTFTSCYLYAKEILRVPDLIHYS